MNKLLIALGIVSIIIGGGFILHNHGLLVFSILNESLASSLLGITLIVLGFIRFNKIIGITMFVVGGISLLSDFNIIPWRIIPLFLLPWILIALAARFLIIGFLSGEHKE